jgi:DNA-binding NtrC family response regulator
VEDSNPSTGAASTGIRSLHPGGKPAALLVSPLEEDQLALEAILQQLGWTLFTVPALGQALTFLRDHPVSVVITEQDLPLGDWKHLLEAIQHLSHTPLLVVMSRQPDEYLWAEVLKMGGYGVLTRPFRAQEMRRMLQEAWGRAEEAPTKSRRRSIPPHPKLKRHG